MRHKLSKDFVFDLFGHFESEDDAYASAAEIVKAFNHPGLLQNNTTKGYIEAKKHRDSLISRHKHVARFSEGRMLIRAGKFYGQFLYNSKDVFTHTHDTRASAERELASLFETSCAVALSRSTASFTRWSA